MITFPNGKINIGLQVTGKRHDGFHDLQTIFYPISIKDVLEIIDSPILNFSSGGLHIDASQNLCVQAYNLLKKDFQIPPVHIHLHKLIPVGAGLGGGSADATSCLQLLNEKCKLDLTTMQLNNYALALGSDCPFFLLNKPCYATGRGEKLEEIALDLSSYKILLVHPGIHINTGWAFSQLNINTNFSDLKKNVSQPVTKWKENILNDFEKPVFTAYPAIEALKNEMYQHGALYAAMSGSGSSVFGIFTKDSTPILNFPPDYFSKWV